MKVSRHSTGQLVLETRPNWLLMAIATVLVLMGAYMAVIPGKEVVLDCERKGTMGICTITENFMYGKRLVVRIPLRLIQGAQASPASVSQNYKFSRLELLVADGRGPFPVTWYGSQESATAAVARITEYVGNPHDIFLKLNVDRRPFFLAVGGLILAMGLGMFLWGAQMSRSTFCENLQHVTIRRFSWRGVRSIVYPFGEIADLHVGGIRQDCNLFLRLNSGQLVPLSSSADMEAMVGPRKIRAIREGTAEQIKSYCRLTV